MARKAAENPTKSARSSKPATPSAQDGLISTEVAGRLLMISAERVRQLIKAEYIARGAGGKIALVAAVQGYIKFLKDEDRRSSKSASDSRVRDARAAEIELRVAERRRVLIEMDEAIAASDKIVAVVRAEIVGLPARATRDMDVRRVIEKEAHESLKRIATTLREIGDDLRAGRDVLGADAEGDA